MTELNLIDKGRITLAPSFDSNGNLELSYNTQALSSYDDNLHAQQTTPPTVCVEIEIVDFMDGNSNQWTMTAKHENSDESMVEWTRDNQGQRSYFAWSETNQFHETTVTATNGSSPQKTKLVFIKVRPYPDAPDL